MRGLDTSGARAGREGACGAEPNAAGLVNPASVITVGRLLAADSCLFLDRIPGTNQPALDFRFVETRTGVVLGHLLAPESDLPSTAGELHDLAASASAKLRMPLERRHYVGIMGFHSQELRNDLDSLAQALEMLVADELDRSPSIILLDREHLDVLTRETSLTDVELALRTSTVLLEGVVARGDSETTAVVRLNLKPLLPGASSETSVRVPKDNIRVARKIVCDAVLGCLPAAAPPVERSGDEGEEGRRFFVRASFLAAHGEPQAALRNAAAAYALDPVQAHLSLLAGLSPGLPGKRLWVQYWKNEVRRLREQGYPATVPEGFAFPVQPLPASGETAEQATERVEDICLEREILRLKLAYHTVVLDQWEALWWDELNVGMLDRMFRYWTRNNEEWERYTRDLLELCVHPPPAVRNAKRMAFELRMLWRIQSNKNNLNSNLNLAKYEGVDRVVAWMRSQDDDLLSLASHSLAWAVGREEPRAALDYFVEHVPLEAPCRKRDADEFAADWILWTIRGIRPPEEQRRYLERILDPIVESGDAARLTYWLPMSQLTGVWWNLLEKHMPPDEASAWLTRAIERLSRVETSPPRDNAACSGRPSRAVETSGRRPRTHQPHRNAALRDRPPLEALPGGPTVR